VITFPWGSVPIAFNMAMSNALLIRGDRTETGRPLAVIGPQTGYFAPQLLVEKDVHGPGIDARGVAFTLTDLYVELGRGRDYAFSATSAGADNVDQFILKLCEPGGGQASTESMGYLYKGQCKALEVMHEVRIAKPSAGGLPSESEGAEQFVVNKYFERAPEYGPLTARGKLKDGTPIAVAVARTTYQNELGSARGFNQINNPDFMARGYDSFREAMGDGVDYTFNWFFINDKDIGYQASCACPKRAKGLDPYLPAWGTGEWDWRGFIGKDELPHELNPDRGYLVSWNNKQAPKFLSSDGQFGWGPIHRSSLLERRLKDVLARGKVSRAQVVDVMALGGTTDLRAQEIVPLAARVMGSKAPPGLDPRTQDLYDRLVAWASDDLGHRRDHNRDGQYEHAQAIAIMDAWWEPLSDAVFKEASADARRVIGIGLHDAPQHHLGSAFQDSFYAHVQKDLRQILRDKVSSPLSRKYCGRGDIDACRSALWKSLSDTAKLLETEFGSSSVDSWKRVIADDDIRHTAIGVVGVPAIHWVNRPTFQQVVQVPGRADQVGSTRGLPATGAPGVTALGVLLTLTALTALKRLGRRAA